LDAETEPVSLEDEYHPIIKPVAKDLKRRVAQNTGGFVLIAGPWGVGKTHLIRAAIEDTIGFGRSAGFYEAEEILQNIRSSYGSEPGEATEDKILARLESLDTLGIDEIDKMSTTDWAKGKMFDLLNGRYTRARTSQPKLTIMTTNERPDTIDGYLASRLRDENSAIFKVWGAPDIRTLRGQDA
jgi:DNA replication protein DnaC